MQNIKICPKCNQASTDANNAFCPFDGTPLVEMQPMQNQQWQQSPAIQPQVISTPSPTPKKKMNPLMIGCLALIGVPIIIFVAMSVAFNSGKNTVRETNANNAANSSSNTATTTPIKEYRSPSDLSSAENLEVGKKYLREGTEGGRAFAAVHLGAVPKNAKEYTEAKKLYAQVMVDAKRDAQRKEPHTRKEVEDELANLVGEDAQLESALDQYEDYEGPAATATKLNALKRKGQIELRRIELERKLKRMPK
jgi:hypothetical protein